MNALIKMLEAKIGDIQMEQVTHRQTTNAKIKLLRELIAAENNKRSTS